MYISDSLKEKSSFISDNFMVNKKLKQREKGENLNSILKQEKLSEGSESYAVFLSERAMMMVKAQQDEEGNLIADTDKLVNQDIKKFYEENGIDINQSVKELETVKVIITDEMKRKNAMDGDTIDILVHVNCFLDAFNKGGFIGNYPPEAVYTMYEKRFGAYARELSEYIDKYGKDPVLHQRIEGLLNKKDPDGTNEVADLVKEITDRIYSGQEDTVDKLVKDRAEEAFVHTYGKEIADSNAAEQKRRERFINKTKKIDEQIQNQRESLQDQIKKLQEKILEEEKKLTLSGKTENEQIRFMKKQLETLQRRLAGLPTDGGMPPDNQDWSDMPIMTWGITDVLEYLESSP